MKIKVMTYNLHSCIDNQNKGSLERVAEIIRAENPDIVGLNEVDAYTVRSRFAHQAKKLAALTNREYYFGPTLKIGPVGFFGNALLAVKPIYKVKNFSLPGNREPRRCLKARVDGPGGSVVVLVTHLGLTGGEQVKQRKELVKLLDLHTGPLILMGDFNCNYEELAPLSKVLRVTGGDQSAPMTYPSWGAIHRLDYIMTTPHFRHLEHYTVPNDASDHLPVVAVMEMV